MSKLNEIIKENTHLISIIGVVATIVTLFFVADGYIDSKIERKITDTKYISQLANQLRPFLIFDDKGIVKYPEFKS